MLGKLLKYEIKATARTFLPLFGLVLLFAAINRLFFSNVAMQQADFSENWIVGLTSVIIATTYGILVCAVFVLVLVVTIQRFYKNLLGDEGYLMFTLPIPTWRHIASKLLIASMWLLSSVLVTALSVCILALNQASIEAIREGLQTYWPQMAVELGMSGGGLMAEVILLLLLSIPLGILPIYCAIALGQLWQKHRIIGALAAYLGISVVTQMCSGVFGNIYFNALSDDLARSMSMGPQINQAIVLYFLLLTLLAAACFAVTNLVLQRKLNLE